MHLLQIVVLAMIQGLAELLPISSSAHVIVAEKLMGLDPTLPQMTLLLVLLHTGTMLAVLVYFGKGWINRYFRNSKTGLLFTLQVVIATVATGIVGYALKHAIEEGFRGAQIEDLFGNLKIISIALACVGVLILFASFREKNKDGTKNLGPWQSLFIGLIQGFCVPFRGFSRSGATISLGLLLGLAKQKAEDFSFALAVVLTPVAIFWEAHRLAKAQAAADGSLINLLPAFVPGLLGMLFSFLAGLLALKWLSNWLSKGRWGWFGVYCLVASALVWWFR